MIMSFSTRASQRDSSPSFYTSLLALVVVQAWAGIVVAQDSERSRYALEEVMVTARKAPEGLQSAPIAISAFSSQEMENRGAQSVADIASAAPNVTLELGGATSGISAAPVTFIRGIGQADFVINTDPAVGIYVDGVYMGRSIGSVLDLLDLERVEVLRGPQGTLFGRNTIGGAFSLVSKDPDASAGFYGDLNASFGENGYRMYQGKANIPVSDNAAARVAGFIRKRDGFVDAVQYDDFQLGEEDVWGVRGTFKVDFSDTFSMTVGADYSDRTDSPAPMTPLDLGDYGVVDENGNAIDGASTLPIGFRFNTAQGIPEAWLATDSGPVSGQFVNNDGSIQAGRSVICVGEALNTNRQCYGDAWIESDPYKVNSVWTDNAGNKIEPDQELEVKGAFARFAWELDFGTLTSITSYREFDSTFYNDNDTTPYIIFQNNNDSFSQDQSSQEFQLVGSVLDDRLDYVLGAFYFEESGLQSLAALFPNIPNCMRSAVRPYCFVTDRFIDNTSMAAYSQLSYHLTDALTLTGGLRYSDSEKEFRVAQTSTTAAGPVVISGDGKLAVDDVDYMLNISWDFFEDAMLYATYSTGFRDGGFPGRFPAGIPDQVESFAPETVTAYELGLKSSWLDNSLRLNAAFFRTEYDDIQVDASSPELAGAPTVFNLASATLEGVELEAVWLITESLRFDASVGYLDTSIDSVVGGGLTTGTPNSTRTITTDNTLPYTPEWQMNLGVNYSYFSANGSEIRTRLDYQWVDEQYFEVANSPGSLAESFQRISANASYIPANSNWELTLGVRNLTDEEYSTAGQFTPINASATVNLSRPRETYATVKYRFD